MVEYTEDEVRLVRSPLLARNLAAGDKLKVIDVSSAEYKLLRRSGNLSIRVFRQHQLDVLAENLSAKIEKLGGSIDKQTDRALVYTIHFSIGFQVIEELLSAVVKDYPDTVWYYGNVYDPRRRHDTARVVVRIRRSGIAFIRFTTIRPNRRVIIPC